MVQSVQIGRKTNRVNPFHSYERERANVSLNGGKSFGDKSVTFQPQI